MSIGDGDGPFFVRARRSPTLPTPKKSSTPKQSSIAFAVVGRVTRTDIPGLCAALALVLEESGGGVVECEVGALVRPDASVVEALARLQLVALRRGSRIRLWNASPELCELIDFMGLRGPLGSDSAQAQVRLSGTPKSGKSLAVSRKNVNSPIRPSDSSST